MPRSSDRPQPAGQLDLGDGVPPLIAMLARDLRTLVERRLAPLDLTLQQAVLLRLSAAGKVTPVQLTTPLGTDSANMTRLLDRLEAKGYLTRQRHPDDRRSLVIELTERGRNLLPQLAPIFDLTRGQLLAGFSPAEVGRLQTQLQRMHANINLEIEAGGDHGSL